MGELQTTTMFFCQNDTRLKPSSIVFLFGIVHALVPMEASGSVKSIVPDPTVNHCVVIGDLKLADSVTRGPSESGNPSHGRPPRPAEEDQHEQAEPEGSPAVEGARGHFQRKNIEHRTLNIEHRSEQPKEGPEVSATSEIQQERDLGGDFREDRRCHGADVFHPADLPVEVLEVIGEGDSLDGLDLDRDFERVAFHMAGDRDHHREAGLGVVGLWRKDKGGSLAGLFATRLRVEIGPHDIAALRDVGGLFHQISFPCGLPQSASE